MIYFCERVPFYSVKMIANATFPKMQFIEAHLEPFGLRTFRLSIFSLVIFTSLVGNLIISEAVWKIPSRKPSS